MHRERKAKRVERKVIKVAGMDKAAVIFDIPVEVNGDTVSFAAFIGEDYSRNLQHIQTAPVKIK